jgi:hypothetical protein
MSVRKELYEYTLEYVYDGLAMESSESGSDLLLWGLRGIHSVEAAINNSKFKFWHFFIVLYNN